jgi:CRP/FNR family transcriptional regulator, cyclic AMP receptor protein
VLLSYLKPDRDAICYLWVTYRSHPYSPVSLLITLLDIVDDLSLLMEATKEVATTMQRAPAKAFDAASFLLSISREKKTVWFAGKEIIFSKGERSDSIFYVEKGMVKLTVTSRQGKEAIIGVFSRGDFFGESCIAPDQPARFHNAVALTNLRAVKIDRNAIMAALRAESDACYGFLAYLLRLNARIQDELVNNLLHSSEERLARTLIFLAQPGRLDFPAKVSQQTLAEMIGTTRQRVNVLMQRFKKLGLIEYGHGLEVRNSLRSVLRND